MTFGLLRRLAIVAVATLLPLISFAAETPAILGVVPYVSSEQLVKFHEPLRVRLERVIGRPVLMVTAPDIGEFSKRTSAGEYDFVLTAAHLGWIAESKNNYVNLAGSSNQVQGLFVAKNDTPIFKLADLKGKTITLPAPMTMIYQMGLTELRGAGLNLGKDVTILMAKTRNNAMYAPITNESDAALTGRILWEKLGREYWDKMRVIGTTPPAPGFFFLANSRVTEKELKQVKTFLLNLADDPAAKSYLESTGLNSFVNVDEKTRRSVDAYTDFSSL